MSVTLDLMEYANDSAAQSAYVSNASASYTSDLCTGGTAIASFNYGAPYTPSNCFDDNVATNWITDYPPVVGTDYIGYDFGSGVTKSIKRFTIQQHSNSGNDSCIGSVKLEYSDDGSSWTTLETFSIAEDLNVNTYTVSVTSSAHRYWRLLMNDTTVADERWRVKEVEMMELNAAALQSYSESTIKTQGSYSLKGIAAITDSLNKTLTRTISPTIDLTDQTQIKFDIYSSRTGANIKIGIHDSGGTTTEKTYTVLSVNTWETVTWDISAVTNANKDAIDQLIITMINADDANTYYLDNIYASIGGARSFGIIIF